MSTNSTESIVASASRSPTNISWNQHFCNGCAEHQWIVKHAVEFNDHVFFLDVAADGNLQPLATAASMYLESNHLHLPKPWFNTPNCFWL
jgi:hypothetical protein